MRKLRSFAALLLALVLAAACCIPAFAASAPDEEKYELQVDFEVVGSPNNGKGYVEGEVVYFSLTVKNTGNQPLMNVTAYEELEGRSFGVGDLAAGASKEFSFGHITTKDDVQTEWMTDKANAVGYGNTGTYVESEYDWVRYQTSKEASSSESSYSTAERAALVLELYSISTPDDKTAYTEGETITYQIIVTNAGNATLYDVTAVDTLTGTSFSFGKMDSGDTKEIIYTYKVTAKNVEDTVVVNSAVATGITDGKKTVKSNEATVSDPTAKKTSSSESSSESSKSSSESSKDSSSSSSGSSKDSSSSSGRDKPNNPATGSGTSPVFAAVGLLSCTVLVVLLTAKKKNSGD